MTHLKRLMAILLVVTMVLATAGIAGAAPADVTGMPCEEAVDYLMELGIVAGYPDGTYQPAQILTRAEVAKIIVLAKMGAEGQALANLLKGASSFSDVPPAHWASGYIKLLQNMGVAVGYPGGMYKPLSPVTHIELVKMLVLAAGLTPAAGAWPTNYLTPGLAEGIVLSGVGADQPLTRCQMALMVAHTIANVKNPATGKTLAQSVFGESMVATVGLVPATSIVGIGGAVQFVATAKDADGAVLTDAAITYTTNDPAKAAVNSTGLFVASASGVYTVTATSGTASGTASVSVFGEPAALRATPSTATVPANGETKVEIKIELVDANGILVADDSETEVEWDYTDDGDNGATDFDSANDTDDGTFENGVCLFEVWATENADVTDILEFHVEDHDTNEINEDIEVVEVEITTVEQIATSVELEADPEELMANHIETGWVCATVLDQAGKGMLNGTYELTFSITGKGTLEGDTDDVTKATGYDPDYDYAHASIEVASVKGDPGSFTVTATGEGLTSDSLTVNTYIAGSPVALKVTVEEGTAEAGELDLEVTFELVDKWGHPTISDVVTWLNFTYDDDDAYFAYSNGVEVELDTEGWFHIDPESPRSTYQFYGKDAGTWTIEVEDDEGDYGTASFDLTITAGDPADISYEPDEFDDTDLLLPITNPKATFTIQLLDEYGNKVAKADEEIEVWARSPRPVKINGTTVDPEAEDEEDRYLTVETDAAGKAVVMFEAPAYVETVMGYEMDFSYNGAEWDEMGFEHMSTIYVTDTLPGSIAFDIENWQDENITTLTADWMGDPDAEGNNYAFVTISVDDTNGNPLDPSTLLEITFSNDGENVQDVWYFGGEWESMDIDDGVYTGSTGNGGDASELWFVFAGAKAGSFTITAKAVQTWTGVSATKSFRTKVGTVVTGAMIFNADGTLADDVDLEADEPVQLRVSLVDYGGNVMVAPADTEVGLGSAVGEFRLTATGTMVDKVTIDGGRTYKTVYFVSYDDIEGSNLSNNATWPLP